VTPSAGTPAAVATTPSALEAMTRTLGGPLEVRDVPASELGWDEVPADARVQAVFAADGRRIAHVHARRGRFQVTRVFGPSPGGVPFLGVVSDALVFGDPADGALRVLAHPTSVKAPLLLEGEYDEPLAGKPRSYPGRVIEWGPFPHAVPDRVHEEVLRRWPGHTVLLEAIDARADGPRTTRIVHPVEAASDADAIGAIARDLEALRADYPQLADFSAEAACDQMRLVVTYAYRTRAPTRSGGGWAAAAPAPEDDGVWLYLDFHDPASTAQIHTQPVVPALHRGPKRVMLLLREGARTRSLHAALMIILARHGVSPGRP